MASDPALREICALSRGTLRLGLGILSAMIVLCVAGSSASLMTGAADAAGALGAGLVMLAIAIGNLAAAARRRARMPSAIRRLTPTAPVHEGTFRDARLGLASEPAFVLRHAAGIRMRLTAVDVYRAGQPPFAVRARHELQLAASILLLRAKHGRRAAPFGFLVYGDDAVRIDLSAALSHEVRTVAAAVRRTMTDANPPARNHRSERRCRDCPFRVGCPDSLGVSVA